MPKPKECPECGEDDVGDKWVKNRHLQYYCRDCGWEDEPRFPEPNKIETSKVVDVTNSGNFEYYIYDKHGHILTMSEAFVRKDKCRKKMLEEMEIKNKDTDIAPVTGVLWPAIVTVKGEVHKSEK